MVHIQGRRWFQRTYGNTYHSVRIFRDGQYVASSGKHYGYGDHYLQTAWAMLQRLGVIPEAREYEGTQALREEFGVSWDVSDVSRSRDL